MGKRLSANTANIVYLPWSKEHLADLPNPHPSHHWARSSAHCTIQGISIALRQYAACGKVTGWHCLGQCRAPLKSAPRSSSSALMRKPMQTSMICEEHPFVIKENSAFARICQRKVSVSATFNTAQYLELYERQHSRINYDAAGSKHLNTQ